jgi:hypothetical protein
MRVWKVHILIFADSSVRNALAINQVLNEFRSWAGLGIKESQMFPIILGHQL